MLVETPVFITGLYRSGTTLLSRALNAHPKLSITYDNVHFMRFCYKKFEPLNNKNVFNLLNDVSERIFERSQIKLNTNLVISELNKLEKIQYSNIYNAIMKDCFLKNSNKLIWGEKTNVAWGAIPGFLKMFPKGKCIFLLRDPRDVLCSYKKMTTNPFPNYLDTIFASLGAFQQASYLTKKISKDNLLILKYENFVTNPEKILKDISSFIGISYNKSMVDINCYTDLTGNKWASNTSYKESLKNISPDSIGRWNKNILEEEICLLELLLKEEMVNYGYKLSQTKYSINSFIKSFEIIRNSPLLTDRFNLWLTEKRGVDTYPNNPSWQPVTVKSG